MRFELWQVPLLVMAGIIAIEFAGRLLLRRLRFTVSAAQMRLAVNATILAALLVFFAIGFFQTDASPADRFVTVVTGIMNICMTYWTYRAFQSTKHAEPGNARDPGDARS